MTTRYAHPNDLAGRARLDRRLHDEAVAEGRALAWSFSAGDNASAACSYTDPWSLAISHRYRIDWEDEAACEAHLGAVPRG